MLEFVAVLTPLVAVCMEGLPADLTFWVLLAGYSCTFGPTLMRGRSHRSKSFKEGPDLASTSAAHGPIPAKRQMRGGRVDPTLSSYPALGERKPDILYLFRGGLMLYTCLCILAVDFPAFPRRYAKVGRRDAAVCPSAMHCTAGARGLELKIEPPTTNHQPMLASLHFVLVCNLCLGGAVW